MCLESTNSSQDLSINLEMTGLTEIVDFTKFHGAVPVWYLCLPSCPAKGVLPGAV